MPETVLEPEPRPANSPMKTRFTPETARLMQERSRQAKAERKLAKLEQERTEREQAELAASMSVKIPQTPSDAYSLERLARVRKQIDRVDDMIQSEVDPARLDRLASTIARLSEIERQLADRPLPGSKRPAQDKPQQSRASILLGGAAESGSGRVEQE